jgi:hypothetical protein
MATMSKPREVAMSKLVAALSVIRRSWVGGKLSPLVSPLSPVATREVGPLPSPRRKPGSSTIGIPGFRPVRQAQGPEPAEGLPPE